MADLCLIDSSVWIEFYRPLGDGGIKSRVTECIGLDLAAVNELIRVEVSRGAANATGFAEISRDMSAFHDVLLSRDVFDAAGRLGFELRNQGLSVPTIDLVIAASAIKYDCLLWHLDKHFELIAAKSLLRSEMLRGGVG